MQQRARTGYLLTGAAAMVWAATGPGIRYLLVTHQIPGLAVAFWRDFFIAVACLGGLLVLRRDMLRVSPHELRSFAIIGAISMGIYHALWVLSIALNGAAVAIVLIYTFPTFVTFGAWLIFREPIRWPQIVALVLALFGCALLVRAYDPTILRASWIGALVGLATGITHAGYVLFSQRSVETRSPWTSLAYTMLFGALTLLVLWFLGAPGSAAVNGERPRDLVGVVGSTATPWLVLLALALGPTLGGYALFTMALRYIPGRIASLVSVIEAPMATLLAVLFLGERLEWAQVLGIGLILGAIGLPRLLEDRSKQLASLTRMAATHAEVESLSAD